jgi:chloramphenicol-sensitive protein RarD
MSERQQDPARTARIGVICAASAYLIWGLVPIYFKAVADVSAFEIIAHRILWTVLLMGGVLLLTRNPAGFLALREEPKLIPWVVLAAFFVTANWLVFVWAVNAGRVLETSLGYYINPLVSVLLGFVFLGERLRPLQMAAAGLAAAGVLNQIYQLGQLPWVSLVLAVTFACYGLLRKRIPLDPVSGLFFETLLTAPIAALYLALLASQGTMAFAAGSLSRDVLIAFSGIVTAVPLVLFAAGASRLRLTTMGFLQYLAPTLTFLQAVLLFDEPFGAAHLVTFGFIWTGLFVYSIDLWRQSRPSV